MKLGDTGFSAAIPEKVTQETILEWKTDQQTITWSRGLVRLSNPYDKVWKEPKDPREKGLFNKKVARLSNPYDKLWKEPKDPREKGLFNKKVNRGREGPSFFDTLGTTAPLFEAQTLVMVAAGEARRGNTKQAAEAAQKAVNSGLLSGEQLAEAHFQLSYAYARRACDQQMKWPAKLRKAGELFAGYHMNRALEELPAKHSLRQQYLAWNAELLECFRQHKGRHGPAL